MEHQIQPEPLDAPSATVFRYETPTSTEAKAVVPLCRSSQVMASVQVLNEGSANNLHAHPHLDGIYFVLRGRARFYTVGNQLIAELAQGEGVLVPRLCPYWFESCGGEQLELLQIETRDEPATDPGQFFTERIDYAPRKEVTTRLMQRTSTAETTAET
jgi:mannose-6-phosphate isomerase-like protein (cupin superfamily)